MNGGERKKNMVWTYEKRWKKKSVRFEMRSCTITIIHMTVWYNKKVNCIHKPTRQWVCRTLRKEKKKKDKKRRKKRRKQFTCLMHKCIKPLVQNFKTTYALCLCPFHDFVSVCLVAGQFCVCVCGASPDALVLPATAEALCSVHLAQSPRHLRRSLSHLCKQGKHALIQRVYISFKLLLNKYQLPYWGFSTINCY